MVTQMNTPKEDFGPKWHYAIAILLGAAIVASFVMTTLPLVDLYRHFDTSHYLEAIRNFLAGKGLLVSTGINKLPVATEPMALWPPGYPLIVAFGSKFFGIDPMWLAPRFNWACWALIPCALLFTLRPVLNNWITHLVGILVMLSPAATALGWQPMSDVPFLLLTIVALGLLFRGSFPNARPGILLLSGFVGALAYSVRNVGVALFASVVGTYIILVFFKFLRPREALQRMVYWGGGALLILVPLLVRNILMFGRLQPYQMPPSSLGLLINIHYFFVAVLGDILSPRLPNTILWNNAVLAAIVLGLLILIAVNRKALMRLWIGWSKERKEMLILLACNLLVGAAAVILARSLYQWNETIGQRHILQYDWILIAGTALLLDRAGGMPRKALIIASIPLVIIFGIRIFNTRHEILLDQLRYRAISEVSDPATLLGIMRSPDDFNDVVHLAISRDRGLTNAIDKLPENTILVSNDSDFIRVNAARASHEISLGSSCKFPKKLTVTSKNAAWRNRLVVLLFPEPALLRSGCWNRLKRYSQTRNILTLSRPYVIGLRGADLNSLEETTPSESGPNM